MSFLELHQINKYFGSFQALKDVNLNIEQGEFVCFLGPSGCGKTTLLRAIAGLDKQDQGKIVMLGKDISQLPPSERDFGIVFQSYALFPNLTIDDNIAYGLKKQPKAAQQKRVMELLDLVGLSSHIGKYPAQLSGGQQQRVALARALAISPCLLLLDEPLSALDNKVRIHLRHQIKELQEKLDVTTIMVTHDQEEALSMADRIVVMNHGKIEQVGTASMIYRSPNSRFVADFIGKMNFIPAEFTHDKLLKIGQYQFNMSFCDKQLKIEDSSSLNTSPVRSIVAAIRPEDILFEQRNTNEHHKIDAKVINNEFLGSLVRTQLSVQSIQDHIIHIDVPINTFVEYDLKEGMSLPVYLPADRIQLFL